MQRLVSDRKARSSARWLRSEGRAHAEEEGLSVKCCEVSRDIAHRGRRHPTKPVVLLRFPFIFSFVEEIGLNPCEASQKAESLIFGGRKQRELDVEAPGAPQSLVEVVGPIRCAHDQDASALPHLSRV